MVPTPQQTHHRRAPSSFSSDLAPAVPANRETAPAAVAAPMGHIFDDGGNPLDDRFINRNTTAVKQLPRSRLSQCLEAISSHLESGFTAECTAHGLLCLLWLYTRIKPSVRLANICDLALHGVFLLMSLAKMIF
jgi:hypothetical protein